MFRVFHTRFFATIFFCAIASPSALSEVRATADVGKLTLSNEAVAATWSVQNGSLQWQSLTNHFTRAALSLDDDVFALAPREGPVVHSTDMRIIAQPVIDPMPESTTSPRAADHLPGRRIRVELSDPSGNVRVTWSAMLREGANYIREEVTIQATQQPFPLV